MSAPLTTGCPLENVCIQTSLDGQKCGALPEHLPPRQLAELLCLSAVDGAIQQEEEYAPNPKFPNDEAEKLCRLGSLYVERSLHPDLSAEEAAANLAKGENYLEDAADHPGAKPKTIIDSDLLYASIPLLQSRKPGGVVTDNMLDVFTADVAEIGKDILDLDDENEVAFGLAKVGFLLTVVRQGVVPYFSTYRESCSMRPEPLPPEHAQLGHNVYLVDDGSKLPAHAVPRSPAPKEGVATISMAEIVRAAVAEVAPSTLRRYTTAEHLKRAVGWAMWEVRGPNRQLGEHYAAILELTGEAILARISHAHPL